MIRNLFAIIACSLLALVAAHLLGFFGPAYGYESITVWFDWGITILFTALLYLIYVGVRRYAMVRR